MNDRENKARKAHRRGSSCSSSVYMTFYDINDKSTGAPMPRSEGGKCGAVLAAEKVLRELGIDKTDEFDQVFLEEFETLRCQELLRSRYSCNDFVGRAAGIAEELIEQ